MCIRDRVAARLLAGAQDDGVDRQDRALLADGDMQSGVVDPVVAHARDHGDAAVLELGAVDPAGGLAEARADLGGLALEEVDGARRVGPLGRGEAAGTLVGHVHAPEAEVRLGVLVGLVAAVGEVLGDVEADASGAEDGDPLADRHLVAQHVEVADDARVVDAGDVRGARADTGGHDDLVVAVQVRCRDGGVEAYVHAVGVELVAEVAQRLVELLLAGDLAGHVELAADLARGVEQGDLVRPGRRRRPRRAWRAGSGTAPARSRGRRAGSPDRR